MKKIFTFLSLISISFGLKAQSSLNVWQLNPSATNTVAVINNGDTLYFSTTASTLKKVLIKFQNKSSANTYTYSVRRKDLVLNAGASAYFCFGDVGTCFPANTTSPLSPFDYTVLSPGQSTTTLNINSADNNLSTDLLEGSNVGYSFIKYKLFNVATGENGADTLTFYMKYNQAMSVNENSSILESVGNVFPNPASTNSTILVSLKQETPVKVQIFNTLGAVVYNGMDQKLAQGKHKILFDCSSLNPGVYFVTVNAGLEKVTKRMVINK